MVACGLDPLSEFFPSHSPQRIFVLDLLPVLEPHKHALEYWHSKLGQLRRCLLSPRLSPNVIVVTRRLQEN